MTTTHHRPDSAVQVRVWVPAPSVLAAQKVCSPGCLGYGVAGLGAVAQVRGAEVGDLIAGHAREVALGVGPVGDPDEDGLAVGVGGHPQTQLEALHPGRPVAGRDQQLDVLRSQRVAVAGQIHRRGGHVAVGVTLEEVDRATRDTGGGEPERDEHEQQPTEQ
jgi:hypothetical protein